MADNTAIEWADASWNPIRARDRETGKVGWFCTHASEGCRFCYAETFNHRLGTGIDYRAQDLARIEIFIDEKILAQPLHWRRPRKIFTLSMSDLFGEFVTDEMIDQVFAMMAICPQHTFQVLTKRAARMRSYLTARNGMGNASICRAINLIPAGQGNRHGALEMPLPNCWLGVSVEDQARADERIPHLLDTPAAKRFISAEPLLSGIDLTRVGFEPFHGGATTRTEFWTDALRGTTTTYEPHRQGGWGGITRGKLDWVIAGGESGPGARPMHPEWARSLRDQCRAADVPYFFKQWGEWSPIERHASGLNAEVNRMAGSACGKWDAETDTIRVGKRAAGRLLDGRTHDAWPT